MQSRSHNEVGGEYKFTLVSQNLIHFLYIKYIFLIFRVWHTII